MGATGGVVPTSSDDVHKCDDVQPTISNYKVQGSGPYTISASWTSGTFTVNKVEFYDNDQIISTSSPSGSGSYPAFTYTPQSTGTHAIKIVVTDAGLYQATKTINVTYSGGTFSNQSPADGATRNAGSISFNWDSLSGATSYKLIINGTTRATPSSSNASVILTPNSYTWHVQALDGSTVLATTSNFHLTVNP
jgi:hypothetical protein